MRFISYWFFIQYGDRVVCYVWTGGLFGEKVIVPANNCFLVPEGISGQDAVALPANYLTAYLSIFTMGNIQPGDTVLIHSIAGIKDLKKKFLYVYIIYKD